MLPALGNLAPMPLSGGVLKLRLEPIVVGPTGPFGLVIEPVVRVGTLIVWTLPGGSISGAENVGMLMEALFPGGSIPGAQQVANGVVDRLGNGSADGRGNGILQTSAEGLEVIVQLLQSLSKSARWIVV